MIVLRSYVGKDNANEPISYNERNSYDWKNLFAASLKPLNPASSKTSNRVLKSANLEFRSALFLVELLFDTTEMFISKNC